MSSLMLSPVLPSWLIALWTLCCLLLLLWDSVRMRATLRGLKAALQAALSCLPILLAAVLLLQPSLVREVPVAGASRLVILQDASRSMEVRDLPGGKPRRELASQVLSSPALERLGTDYRLEREGPLPHCPRRSPRGRGGTFRRDAVPAWRENPCLPCRGH